MIYLKYSQPGAKEIDFATGTTLVTIGTSPDNIVQLTGDGIQARHAQIDAANLCITDLGAPSHAGFKINGELETSATLENGDVISIGDWTMRFYHTDEEYVSERDTRTLKVASIHSGAATQPLAAKKQ